jgi:hypothetical protein
MVHSQEQDHEEATAATAAASTEQTLDASSSQRRAWILSTPSIVTPASLALAPLLPACWSEERSFLGVVGEPSRKIEKMRSRVPGPAPETTAEEGVTQMVLSERLRQWRGEGRLVLYSSQHRSRSVIRRSIRSTQDPTAMLSCSH